MHTTRHETKTMASDLCEFSTPRLGSLSCCRISIARVRVWSIRDDDRVKSTRGEGKQGAHIDIGIGFHSFIHSFPVRPGSSRPTICVSAHSADRLVVQNKTRSLEPPTLD